MNKFIEWFTKKKILVLSLVLVLFFAFFYLNYGYNVFCGGNHINENCGIVVKFVKLLLYITPSLFIFSLLGMFLKERVFVSWRKFSFIFALIYLILLLIFPWYWGDAYLNFQKVHMAYFGTILYSIISLILIVYKSLKKQ